MTVPFLFPCRAKPYKFFGFLGLGTVAMKTRSGGLELEKRQWSPLSPDFYNQWCSFNQGIEG
ncbi:hypothetical protein A3842_07985 [Paenibacillus sp. P3E]|uniref:hypothetical protein n=1 Tax=Paenibacillus sp. P3E TaxID=1349435 RepID=UPI00093DF04C|nr:hypothetical protein [Paenibacillus sp. P3E]OKP84163.1 hypothetical protein A3842_07985 [Paenibacillus sp. P3E]